MRNPSNIKPKAPIHDSQPSLFGFQRPRFKYPPITRQRIQEAKALLAKNDLRGVYETLRDLRYKLEAFEKRITSKPSIK